MFHFVMVQIAFHTNALTVALSLKL